jgi:hypothetical protein
MCCFSRPIIHVSRTNIFARTAPGGRQLLAYEMSLRAAEDLAMILPLPVAPGAGEDAVSFIDLSGYPKLFGDLAAAFPEPVVQAGPVPRGLVDLAKTLPVVAVGSFEASFVPTAGDFARLDARFRLPTEVWSLFPGYERFGFAVFKLKRGEHRVHPMAFSFPTARPEALFFPTVHIHDGAVHAEARFDHSLFCQWRGPLQTNPLDAKTGWRRSFRPAREYVNVEKSKGLIDPDDVLLQRRLQGSLPNRDIYLEA